MEKTTFYAVADSVIDGKTVKRGEAVATLEIAAGLPADRILRGIALNKFSKEPLPAEEKTAPEQA